jgi:hypothetical protein
VVIVEVLKPDEVNYARDFCGIRGGRVTFREEGVVEFELGTF